VLHNRGLRAGGLERSLFGHLARPAATACARVV
jgi:hypothetical protein